MTHGIILTRVIVIAMWHDDILTRGNFLIFFFKFKKKIQKKIQKIEELRCVSIYYGLWVSMNFYVNMLILRINSFNDIFEHAHTLSGTIGDFNYKQFLRDLNKIGKI